MFPTEDAVLLDRHAGPRNRPDQDPAHESTASCLDVPVRVLGGGYPRAIGVRDGSAAGGRATVLAVVDVVAVGLFLVAAGWIAARLVTASFGTADIALLPAEFVVGYLAADLASGLVHWFCDSFFDEETPIIGHALIRPFREHHSDPVAMTRHGFLEVNGNNCLVLLFPLLPMAVLGEPAMAGGEVPWLAFQLTALAFALVTFATNQFHKWAHLPEPRPPIVRWLQATGLVLTPSHHARHHLPPHAAAFCVTAGWMSPLFDRLVRRRLGA